VGRWDAASTENKYGSKNEWQNLGGDVKVVPSSSWTMDLSYRPDFAQVDVDDEIINLSDYPVYVTEKRPFFLESKELFDDAPVSLLYTRRINNPEYGGKTNFQQDNFRASLLAARDDNTAYGSRNVAAGRGILNLGGTSTLGFTGTFLKGLRQYSSFHAATGSVDARLRWKERDQLVLAAAGVERSGFDAQPFQGYADLYEDLRLTSMDVTLDYHGKDYNINDLGWDSYSNVMSGRFLLTKAYYPRTSLFQYVGYDASVRRRFLADGTYPETFFDGNLYATTRENLQLQVGSEWGDWYRRNYYTALDKPLRDNFGIFRPELHPVSTHWVAVTSDDRQPVEVVFSGSFGTLYEGRQWTAEPEVTVKPRANLDVMVAYSQEEVHGAIDFDSTRGIRDFRIWRLRAKYSPTLNLSLRGTMQWRADLKAVQTNLLLAWNWHSGSWFYVVYDETGRPTEPLAYAKPGDRTVRLKWTYYFTVP